MYRHNDNINRILSGDYSINSKERKVYIVHRTLGGAVGGWAGKIWRAIFAGPGEWPFLDNDVVPDLTHHWAVRVGDWYHQLQVKGGWNFYENDKYDAFLGAWDQYEVGVTRYNDAAIVSAAVQAMNEMPESYHLLNNNCQTYVLRLLDKICRNGSKKVGPSWLPFRPQIAFVPGQELGRDAGVEPEIEIAYVLDGAAHMEQLQSAFDIMEKHTPMLNQQEFEQVIQQAQAETETQAEKR